MKARPYIESGKGITPTVVVAELGEKYRRDNIPFAQDLEFILAKTRIIPLDTTIAQKAGSLSFERKRVVRRWGLADSIVLASARECRPRL